MTEMLDESESGSDAEMLDVTEAEILADAIRDAASTNSGASLDLALEGIGWGDALDVAPRLVVGSLFDAQGRAGTTSGSLGRLLRHCLDLPAEGPDTALLPAFGTSVPPATTDGVQGLGTHDLMAAPHVVVVAQDGSTRRWCTLAAAELRLRAVGGLDPRLGLVEVSGAAVAAGNWRALDASWSDAVARCRLAVGHELVGTMRTMLELARIHALDRVQFDRPISGFQAVRHRLAESLVAVEAAEAALDGAWDDGSVLAAALAKAVCGESARTVRRHCQQVLAGIGFTSEHDLHRYVRRSIVLDGLFGDARTISTEVGESVLRSRELPALLPL